MSPQSYTSRVKFFDEKKGYGFVWNSSNDRSCEVFVHEKQFSSGLKNLCQGDLISFEMKSSDKGLFATKVKLVNKAKDKKVTGGTK